MPACLCVLPSHVTTITTYDRSFRQLALDASDDLIPCAISLPDNSRSCWQTADHLWNGERERSLNDHLGCASDCLVPVGAPCYPKNPVQGLDTTYYLASAQPLGRPTSCRLSSALPRWASCWESIVILRLLKWALIHAFRYRYFTPFVTCSHHG